MFELLARAEHQWQSSLTQELLVAYQDVNMKLKKRQEKVNGIRETTKIQHRDSHHFTLKEHLRSRKTEGKHRKMDDLSISCQTSRC